MFKEDSAQNLSFFTFLYLVRSLGICKILSQLTTYILYMLDIILMFFVITIVYISFFILDMCTYNYFSNRYSDFCEIPNISTTGLK